MLCNEHGTIYAISSDFGDRMTILRLLGSSDDKEKEKIGVARSEGPPLRGFRSKVFGR